MAASELKLASILDQKRRFAMDRWNRLCVCEQERCNEDSAFTYEILIEHGGEKPRTRFNQDLRL